MYEAIVVVGRPLEADFEPNVQNIWEEKVGPLVAQPEFPRNTKSWPELGTDVKRNVNITQTKRDPNV